MKNSYSYGWTDPRMPNFVPNHERTIWLNITKDYDSFVEFNQVNIHNDQIHGVKDADTDSERV
jgi:hypothetical protein